MNVKSWMEGCVVPTGVRCVVGAAVYPFKAASTRLRLGVLAAPLEDLGMPLLPWTYLDDRELDPWVSGNRVTSAVKGAARVPALMGCIRSASALVVQRECLPWNTIVPESAAARRMPLIWDVDDAMWLSSPGMRGYVRGGASKYAKLARMATEVWAGSETVASWCHHQGARAVRVVPTVTPIPARIGVPVDPPRLAWVGTPAAGRYLQQVLEANQSAFREWTIEVVGAGPMEFPGLRIESHPWSQANEDRALSRAWAGIYPIDTQHDFSAGKSALKAVLMGAHGLPVIATSTPSNAEVIEQGATGLLIDADLGWSEALRTVSDRGLRDQMGWAARARIEADFNPATWGRELASVLAGLVET